MNLNRNQQSLELKNTLTNFYGEYGDIFNVNNVLKRFCYI